MLPERRQWFLVWAVHQQRASCLPVQDQLFTGAYKMAIAQESARRLILFLYFRALLVFLLANPSTLTCGYGAAVFGLLPAGPFVSVDPWFSQ